MIGTEFKVEVYSEKEGDYIDAIATITGYSPEVDSVIDKAPEDCYPGEAEEIDFIVTINGEEIELEYEEYEEIGIDVSEQLNKKLVDEMQDDADERASEARAERMDW